MVHPVCVRRSMTIVSVMVAVRYALRSNWKGAKADPIGKAQAPKTKDSRGRMRLPILQRRRPLRFLRSTEWQWAVFASGVDWITARVVIPAQ
jgi:hypothetical protein